MIAGGAAFAQADTDDFHVNAGLLSTGAFNAVPTLSTEARFSAGLFTTDVDNFINPRFHNPQIGTFFFLGGFPGESDDVSETERPGFVLSGGFGRTLADGLYLAVYYGGSLADGGRTRTKQTGGSELDERDAHGTATLPCFWASPAWASAST